MRITFDTNMCNLLHSPAKRTGQVSQETIEYLVNALATGVIKGFYAAGSIALESLGYEDKLNYLANRPFEAPSAQFTERFDALSALGLKALQAPMVGLEVFYDPREYAPDEVYDHSTRQARFRAFTQRFPGADPLIRLGESLLQGQPQVSAPVRTQGTTPDGRSLSNWSFTLPWAIALQRAAAEAGSTRLREQISGLLSEWNDELILGAHQAYGNDIFCTTDEGKAAGAGSVLHLSNRAALASGGIRVASPQELERDLKTRAASA